MTPPRCVGGSTPQLHDPAGPFQALALVALAGLAAWQARFFWTQIEPAWLGVGLALACGAGAAVGGLVAFAVLEEWWVLWRFDRRMARLDRELAGRGGATVGGTC